MKTSVLKVRQLEHLVAVADSGTWGDEGTPTVGSPVLRSTNITENRMDLRDPAWRIIPENDRERRRLRSGDIIVTKSSGSPDHIGKCAIFQPPGDGQDYYFSNFMLRLRAEPELLDHRWLYYWLTSNRGRSALEGLNSTTTGLRNLNVGQYLSQKIPLPCPDDPARSLLEQKRIADILDKGDAIRRKRQDALATTVLFLGSAFQSMFGDPYSDASGCQGITLADADIHISDGNYSSKYPKSGDFIDVGVPFIRANNLNRGTVTPEDMRFISEAQHAELRKGHLKAKDILIVTRGSIGEVALVPDAFEDANINAQLVLLRCTSRQFTPEFLIGYFSTPSVRQQLVRLQTGTALQQLPIGKLVQLRLPLVAEDEQKRFASMFQKQQAILTTQTSHCEASNDLFTTLAHRAFRGEL